MDVSIPTKGTHIIKNIRENELKHDFLNGVEKFIPIIIQTEGLFPNYGIIQIHDFEYFLKELKRNADNNTLEEFLINPFKPQDYIPY